MTVETFLPNDAANDLREQLQRNPTLLAQRQDEAGRVYRQARAIPGSPTATIDAQWQSLRHQAAVAAREVPSTAAANSEAAIRFQVKMLSLSNEAIATFGKYLTMTRTEMQAAWTKDRDAVVTAGFQREAAFAAGVAAAAMSAFDARLAVAQLAAKGIGLSAGYDGSLMASNAGALSDCERDVLRRHRAEILALLSTLEKVA